MDSLRAQQPPTPAPSPQYDSFWRHQANETLGQPQEPGTLRGTEEDIHHAAAIAEAASIARKQRLLQCTHMDMIRVPGNRQCQACGRMPVHGFLYKCRQDFMSPAPSWPLTADMDFIAVSGNHIIDSTLAAVSQAEILRMSPSIINQIRQGRYTQKELAKLFNQRAHVIRTLRASTSDSVARTVGTPMPVDVEKVWFLNAQRPDLDGVSIKSMPCEIEICHSCKPWLESRVYEHPDTAWEYNSQSFLDRYSTLPPPVRNAGVMKHIILPGEHPKPCTRRPSHLVSRDATFCTASSSISMSSSIYSSDSTESELFPFTDPVVNLPGHQEREQSSSLSMLGLADTIQTSSFDTSSVQDSTPLRRRLFLQSTPSQASESPATDSETSSNSPLTPFRPLQESFEASFEKNQASFGKSASFSGPFRHLDRADWPSEPDTGTGLGIRRSSGPESALTEESVENGEPDVVFASLPIFEGLMIEHDLTTERDP